MSNRKMSERDKKIMDTFEKTFPFLSEMEKERLLTFGEGIAFFKGQMQQEKDGSGK